MANNTISQRAKEITPFHVMDILAQAKKLEAQGKDIIHMEVGEPDFITPQPIIDAGIAALKAGQTHYTPALGLPELRHAISDWYQRCYQVNISPERVVITPGASGALLLVMGALLERDQKVLLADPGYPCNRNFARFVEGQTQSIAVDESTNYQLTSSLINKRWDADTAMALVASPSNPTGTVLSKQDLIQLSDAIRAKNGHFVVDEIYHGLTYDDIKLSTVLAIDNDAFVINSFSKFFGMTGWRLGWLIVPDQYVAVMDRLAQNLFLSAPTMSQYGALTAFSAESLDILEQRRQIFEHRRNSLLPALQTMGLDVKITPQGAFYIYGDCSAFLNEQHPDSMALSKFWLQHTGVAVTPGNDFGSHLADRHIRFAYTNDEQRLLEAVDRISAIYK